MPACSLSKALCLTTPAVALVLTLAAPGFAADLPVAPPPHTAFGGHDPIPVARFTDAEIDKKLAAEGVKASPPADDAEFLRRVYLDIAGVIPTAERVAAFLDSQEPDRRAKLIDELLASPDYAKRMTDIWKALLIPNTAASDRQKHEPFTKWLNESFAANKPLDAMAREVLSASGFQDQNGVVTFFMTHETLDEITDRVSRVFLGVQLQCAQCHNHPFGDWTQEEYWGMASFFLKVKQVYAKEGSVQRYGTKEDNNAKAKPYLMVPASLKKVEPTFLRGEKPNLSPDSPALPALAEWVASPKNPYFARAAVNRVWHQFFSRGLVNPVDDMIEANAPTHPELLAVLTQEFIDSGFDVKHLVRCVCNSQAYQRTSKAAEGNDGDKTLFSHMAVKVLSPQQLFDSLESVFALAHNEKTPKPTDQTRKVKAGERGRFATYFRGEDDADPTDYQAGIPQALYLMNAGHHYSIARAANEVVSKRKTPEAVVETMFLATLSRRPTEREARAMVGYLTKAADKRGSNHDVLWALMNSTEFISNH